MKIELGTCSLQLVSLSLYIIYLTRKEAEGNIKAAVAAHFHSDAIKQSIPGSLDFCVVSCHFKSSNFTFWFIFHLVLVPHINMSTKTQPD